MAQQQSAPTSGPPGLSMPPGLNFNQQQQGGNQPQFQPQQQLNGIPPQPDLSSIGPHTSSAQLAALLASVGTGPELNPFVQPQQHQQQHHQHQQPPFGGAFHHGGVGGGLHQQPQPQLGGMGNFNQGGFGGNNNQFGGLNSGNSMAFGGGQQQPGPQSSNPCRMHQQGQCRYGATCRFTHVGPAGGGGGHSFGQSNSNQFGGNNSFGARGGNQFNQNNFDQQQPNLNNFRPQQQQQQQQPQQILQQQSQQLQQQQQQAQQQDKLDASAIGAFNPNVPAFVPTASSGVNSTVTAGPPPNQALLQALLLQQQLNTQSGGAPNADLEQLIASLSKPNVPTPAILPTNDNLNNEFLQAQQQLASLALGGGASRPQPNPSQQPGGFGGSSSYGNRNSQPFAGGPNYGNKHNQHHQHQSHQQNGAFGNATFPSFHAGGNFGGANGASLGAPQQIRFYSNVADRDQRREQELFGPAHTTTTGINFDKYDDIPVEVTGNEVPGEMKAFSDFDFPDVIRQNIELSKYVKPTPIQKFALPVAFLGRDLMACAQTGSGKTAAFLLPFIAHLVINGRPAPQGGQGRNRRYMPVGLILAPTRELATQIWEESLKFTYCTSIHSVVVYGGQDIRQQFRELDRGCDIIVGTPGRLMDFVERGRISLAQISYLCLDEADRMLDMGFEPQIRNIVLSQDMSEVSKDNRQTLMFSATFPKEIQRLAQDFLYNYIFIAVGRVGASSDFITQSVDWVLEENKRNQLMQYLPKFKGLTLIFVERKKSADLLETYLNREGFQASSIHGDRSQHERESALQQFRNGRCPILVATDVAARGLDIPNVLDVVNFDMPNTIDDYVHRIGRTGRAGNTGNAWSFVNEKANHLFKDLYDMLHENKQVVPEWLATMVESRNGGMRGGQGGGGGKRFGGKDYRSGGKGYGSHSGGRGGMAQHNLGKRFTHGGNHGGHGGQQQHGGAPVLGQPQQHMVGGAAAATSAMFPGGFGGANAGGALRPHHQGQPQQNGGFNHLASAMTGRAFPQQH